MAVTQIEAATLGDGWLAVSRAILERGVAASWGGIETREVPGLTLEVERPATADPVIAELGDPVVELAHLQEHVAGALGVPVGRLTLHVKTAHVYATEWALMAGLSGSAATVA